MHQRARLIIPDVNFASSKDVYFLQDDKEAYRRAQEYADDNADKQGWKAGDIVCCFGGRAYRDAGKAIWDGRKLIPLSTAVDYGAIPLDFQAGGYFPHSPSQRISIWHWIGLTHTNAIVFDFSPYEKEIKENIQQLGDVEYSWMTLHGGECVGVLTRHGKTLSRWPWSEFSSNGTVVLVSSTHAIPFEDDFVYELEDEVYFLERAVENLQSLEGKRIETPERIITRNQDDVLRSVALSTLFDMGIDFVCYLEDASSREWNKK